MSEPTRIEDEFARRDSDSALRERYTFFNPGHLHALHERERHLLALLAKHGFGAARLATSRTLAVGCGAGAELLDLVRYGVPARAVCGVDLSVDRVAAAKARGEGLGIVRGSGAALPWRSGTFDLVSQFTVLSSVLDDGLRRAIAAEMLRVLKPDGAIVWYDFWADNPSNRAVRGIRAAEVRALFPGCSADLRRVTLPPPLTRALAPVSWLLADVLSRVPGLQTFYVGVVRRVA